MESQEDFKDMERLLRQDPPVIVGGGGSAFVWIRRDLATLVADVSTIPNTAPHPATPRNYIVYKVDIDAIVAAISKGDGSVTLPIPLNSRLHATVIQ